MNAEENKEEVHQDKSDRDGAVADENKAEVSDDEDDLFGDDNDGNQDAGEKPDESADKIPSEDAEVSEKNGEDDDDDSLFGNDSDEEQDNSAAKGNIDRDEAPNTGIKKLGKAKKAARLKEKSDKDEFIASDDDQESVARSYEGQKEFADEVDPFADDKNPNQIQNLDGTMVGAEVEENEVDAVVKRIKARSKRKSDMRSEEQKEDHVLNLLQRMDKAYEDDLNCQRNGEPAVHKLKMVSEVCEEVSKASLQTIFLERNLLQVLGQWLRPSVYDGSLPDLTIRTKVYKLLPSLPIESDHLKRANFGKVISYLKDSEKEEGYHREALAGLIRKWTRVILRKTDNYKMLETMQMRENKRQKKQKPRKSYASEVASVNTFNDIKRLKVGEGEQSYRARIPQQRELLFSKRVTSNPNAVQNNRPRPRASKLPTTRESLLKKLKTSKKK